MGWQREPGQRPRRRLFDSASEMASGMAVNGGTGNQTDGKVMTVQELNAKRDAIFQKSLQSFQSESQNFHDRQGLQFWRFRAKVVAFLRLSGARNLLPLSPI